MPEFRIQLKQLLKKIGIDQLVLDSCDEDLHTFVCQLLCVDKTSDSSCQHLNKINRLM